MRFFCGIAFTMLLMAQADASCVCRCVDGEVQPLCSSSIDLPPICAQSICSIVPPSITPIQPSLLPPLGTSSCSQHQVLNPVTNRYEWRSICN
jgi:hypothetical protein